MQVNLQNKEQVHAKIKELYFVHKLTVGDIFDKFEEKVPREEIQEHLKQAFDEFKKNTMDDPKRAMEHVAIEFIESDNSIIKTLLDVAELTRNDYVRQESLKFVHMAHMDKIDIMQKLGIIHKAPDRIEISKIDDELAIVATVDALAKKKEAEKEKEAEG